MNIKKNLNDMTGAAAELREGMKGVWLAKKIKEDRKSTRLNSSH